MPRWWVCCCGATLLRGMGQEQRRLTGTTALLVLSYPESSTRRSRGRGRTAVTSTKPEAGVWDVAESKPHWVRRRRLAHRPGPRPKALERERGGGEDRMSGAEVDPSEASGRVPGGETELAMRNVWEASHILGAGCMCIGRLLLRVSSGWDRFQTLASAGWLRGWAWSSFVIGGMLLLGSIAQLSTLPDSSLGSGLAMLCAGVLLIAMGPALITLGNHRFRVFMSTELEAILKFPRGATVEVVADPDTPELSKLVGSRGDVVGHRKGRAGVFFSSPEDRATLRALFTPAHAVLGRADRDRETMEDIEGRPVHKHGPDAWLLPRQLRLVVG
eukprot:Hpha_TRINITY_DN15790_c3_g10::TRINITY_DN15790_c3_g10_i1::g.38508::m.38508